MKRALEFLNRHPNGYATRVCYIIFYYCWNKKKTHSHISMHVWNIFVVNEKHDVRRGIIPITMVKDKIWWIQYKGLKWEPTNFECHVDYGSNYFTIFRIILTSYRSRNGRWETTLESIHSCMYDFFITAFSIHFITVIFYSVNVRNQENLLTFFR